MAPDPQGTSPAGSPEVGVAEPIGPSPLGPYDRSSLRGDFLVMIRDQTEEDYRRRRPGDRESEFVNGAVYLHASEADTEDPAEIYDRSSLAGNFLVLIPGQTEEDYLRLRPEKGRCEFIDGVVYMHAAAEKQHQFDAQLLFVLLHLFCQVRAAGIVLMGPSALRTGPVGYVEPDVFVMPNEAGSDADPLFWHPPALLVVEVLSPSTRGHDLDDKFAIYRQISTPEVWFVDHRERVVIARRPTSEGIETRKVKSGPLYSTGLPGFWFDVDWLWADPRPNLMRCLDQILAGQPV